MLHLRTANDVWALYWGYAQTFKQRLEGTISQSQVKVQGTGDKHESKSLRTRGRSMYPIIRHLGFG